MIHSPIVLETPRLILRTQSEGDAQKLKEFEARNVNHFVRWQPTPIHSEVDKSSIRFSLFLREAPEGDIMGECSFSQIIRGVFHACYLGYRIDATHEGKGLMREAVKRAIQFMFEEQNLHRIMAGYMPVNARSAKLLQNLGFTIEGHAKDYLLINGWWEDHMLTSLINPKWHCSNYPVAR